MKPAVPGGARKKSAHQNASPRTRKIAGESGITTTTAGGEKLKICFSYTTPDKAIVERVKQQLEQQFGYDIKWGLNVGQKEGTDWLNQWMQYCRDADVVINFISERYLKSQACMTEWNLSQKKKLGQILNVTLGGYPVVEAIQNLEPEDVAPQGGANLITYFINGGQSLLLERDDVNIAGKIHDELKRTLLKDIVVEHSVVEHSVVDVTPVDVTPVVVWLTENGVNTTAEMLGPVLTELNVSSILELASLNELGLQQVVSAMKKNIQKTWVKNEVPSKLTAYLKAAAVNANSNVNSNVNSNDNSNVNSNVKSKSITSDMEMTINQYTGLYTGVVNSAGQADGKGVFRTQGNEWEASFKDGMLEGLGYIKLSNGACFVKEYHANVQVGEGVNWGKMREQAWLLTTVNRHGGSSSAPLTKSFAMTIMNKLGADVPEQWPK